MWRNIHSWLGLVFGLLILTLSLTGAILATQAISQAYSTPAISSTLTVAEVIKHIAEKNPRIQPQKLVITEVGEAKLSYSLHNRSKENAINLETGKFQRAYKEPKFYKFIRDLHRSFLLGETGRIFPAIAGICISILSLSGLILLLRKLGGIKGFFRASSWKGSADQHSSLGKIVFLPICIIAFTAVWLSATTYHLVPTGEERPPAYPESKEKLTPVKPWDLIALQQLPVKKVREVIYPIADDWFDVWTVKTTNQYLFIDQFTGKIISQEKLSIFERILDWVKFLHTASGSIIWAFILLLTSLSIVFFTVTGGMIWWKNRTNSKSKIKHNSSAKNTAILILVGSEQGSTWHFANALHQSLVKTGKKTRIIAMNALQTDYPKLETMLVLTSTYGNGDAPSSADNFLTLLEQSKLVSIRYACLSFGDKSYPNFCAFGKKVEKKLADKFGKPLLANPEIDRQSAQAFIHWTKQLSEVLEMPFSVEYHPKRPKTQRLRLQQKTHYLSPNFKTQEQIEIVVLRFTADKIAKHQAGDLLAIYPPQTAIPRFYSLGSNSQDQFIEICVRKQQGGLCSTWLHQLELGQEIEVSFQTNPSFHLPQNRPAILIGAGTGIAPFTGMIRHNSSHHPLILLWGGRHPEFDALYASEITQWLDQGKLKSFIPAWSQIAQAEYVQDKIRQHQDYLVSQLQTGAVIMVCGSITMAQAVQQEFEQICQQLGFSVNQLKQQQRYLEDVY